MIVQVGIRLHIDVYTSKRAARSDFCIKNVTIAKSTEVRHVDRQISNIEYVCKQKVYDGDYIYITRS